MFKKIEKIDYVVDKLRMGHPATLVEIGELSEKVYEIPKKSVT